MRWLSQETGERYRLLSEAEWEYVARGGTGTARYWGEGTGEQCLHANGADASTDFDWKIGCHDNHGLTSPVGSFRANDFGLYDVLGNVGEWTQDCWHDSYDGAPDNGNAWESEGCVLRVVHGGSWGSSPRELRSADRNLRVSIRGNAHVGFRVARTLAP